MVHLNLERCERVYGNLGDLAGFGSLVQISLRNTETTGDLQSLAHLVGLEYIAIDECDITGNLVALSNLEKLKFISMAKCQRISGSLDVLARAVDLEHLDLKFCRAITGDVKSLPGRLRNVDVTWCSQITGSLRGFGSLVHLEDLTTSFCQNIKSGCLGDVAGLTNILELNLKYCGQVRHRWQTSADSGKHQNETSATQLPPTFTSQLPPHHPQHHSVRGQSA
jgi:hypothetical protein